MKAEAEQMEEELFRVLKWFQTNSLGNPFNYNRAFEWLQARLLGFELTKVGGGSDGIKETGETAEFKAAAWKGFSKNGQELTHSFTYNGTSRFETWEEQEEYAKKKIMRDPYHYWSIIDYDVGCFIKTYKVPSETVWKLIDPKWYNSWKDSANRKDPRIGGAISTKALNGKEFEIIVH